MEQKNNTIRLFKNNFKTEKKHPEMKGKAVVEGKKWDASAWMNEDKNGNPWFNISLEEPYKKDEESVSYDDANTSTSTAEIPF